MRQRRGCRFREVAQARSRRVAALLQSRLKVFLRDCGGTFVWSDANATDSY
jgi:hypothetical protein